MLKTGSCRSALWRVIYCEHVTMCPEPHSVTEAEWTWSKTINGENEEILLRFLHSLSFLDGGNRFLFLSSDTCQTPTYFAPDLFLCHVRPCFWSHCPFSSASLCTLHTHLMLSVYAAVVAHCRVVYGLISRCECRLHVAPRPWRTLDSFSIKLCESCKRPMISLCSQRHDRLSVCVLSWPDLQSPCFQRIRRHCVCLCPTRDFS